MRLAALLLLLALPVHAAEENSMFNVWAAMGREMEDMRRTISEQQHQINGLQRKIDVIRGRSDCA